MKAFFYFPRSGWLSLLGSFLAVLLLVACETSSSDGTDEFDPVGAAARGGQASVGGSGGPIAPTGSGGMIAPTGSGGMIAPPGSGHSAPISGQSAAGSSGSAPVAGQDGTGNGGGEQTEDCVPQKIEVPPPNCAGLIGYELTVCVGIARGELPATCQGLCGTDKDQCCARVRDAQLELASYPECDQGPICPQSVLDQLKNNPYGNNITDECGTCICESCNRQVNQVNNHGQSAITMLQCGLGHLVYRDCFVCNPGPCDLRMATNLMTGPCSQEVLAACPGCNCYGAFDVNCNSLATCLDQKTASAWPCAAAHATAECVAANCPACPTFTPCVSALMQ